MFSFIKWKNPNPIQTHVQPSVTMLKLKSTQIMQQDDDLKKMICQAWHSQLLDLRAYLGQGQVCLDSFYLWMNWILYLFAKKNVFTFFV